MEEINRLNYKLEAIMEESLINKKLLIQAENYIQ
jgi:hypothetical protein